MPACQAALAVALHRVRGHRDDRRVPVAALAAADLAASPRSRPSPASGSPSAPRRTGLPRQRLERLGAVRHDVRAVAELARAADRHLLVDDVVLGEQQPCARLRLDLGRSSSASSGARGAAAGSSTVARTLVAAATCAPAWSGWRRCPRRARRRPTDAPRRGQQHERDRRQLGSARIARASVEAVHPRHLHVEERDVERLARVRGRVQQPQRLAAVLAVTAACTPRARSCCIEDRALGRVVVDDQDAHARAEVGAAVGAARRPPAHRRSSAREPEAAALARARSRTPICPPISSASRLQIASPSPVPPYLRVVEASAWENGWNSSADSVRRDADPGVGDLEAQQCVAPSPLDEPTRTTTSPCSVNLIALPTRLRQDLPQAARVAAHRERHVRLDARAPAPGPWPARARRAARRPPRRRRAGRSRAARAPACRPRSSRSRGCR